MNIAGDGIVHTRTHVKFGSGGESSDEEYEDLPGEEKGKKVGGGGGAGGRGGGGEVGGGGGGEDTFLNLFFVFTR